MNTTISSSASATLQNSSGSVDNEASVQTRTSIQGTQAVQTVMTAPSMTVEELTGVVEAMNDTMTQMNRALSFEVDSSSEQLVIKVTDKNTDELIRQIPSEDTLKLVQHIEEMRNILFEASA